MGGCWVLGWGGSVGGVGCRDEVELMEGVVGWGRVAAGHGCTHCCAIPWHAREAPWPLTSQQAALPGTRQPLPPPRYPPLPVSLPARTSAPPPAHAGANWVDPPKRERKRVASYAENEFYRMAMQVGRLWV